MGEHPDNRPGRRGVEDFWLRHPGESWCITLSFVLEDANARRLLHAWALDAEAFALVLALLDPTWRSEVHALAGGRLVLSGAGAGFVQDATDDVTALTVPATAVSAAAIAAPTEILVRPVTNEDDLRLWLATSALGWGHHTPAARAASDAFGRAAYQVDGESMVLAFARSDERRPVGCASSTIRGGIATLGGMSTIPTERRRGVQAALVRHRLARAVAHGCEMVASTAAVGSASERNLVRLGFEAQFPVETWARPGEDHRREPSGRLR